MTALDDLLAILTTRRTVAGWLHQWRDPDARLTPLELIARWCAEQLERKTMRQWASIGPTLRSPTDPPESADTAPITMLEAALLAGISANDRAVEAGHHLGLLYEHVRIQALHLAARDPLFPRDERQVSELAAFIRGEADVPPYVQAALSAGRGAEAGGG